MSVYEMVNGRIIGYLESGTIPWIKGWRGNDAINYVTRKPYQGINTLLLPFDGEYLSYKQCAAAGGSIKKGEKAFMICYFKFLDKKDEEKDEEQKIPLLRYYSVFHISQCVGIESKNTSLETKENKPIVEAEAMVGRYVAESGLTLRIVEGHNKATYSRASDCVTMPALSQFISPEEYYSTLFHELVHSTGHEKRLSRLKYGSDERSREELVAEIGAAFLNSRAGIDNEQITKNNAAYIQSWIKTLSSDKKMIIVCAGAAQKAVNLIIGKGD